LVLLTEGEQGYSMSPWFRVTISLRSMRSGCIG
jgi:hypothetical protein